MSQNAVSKKNANRIEWIDLVRALAILTVLYIHATDGIYIISSDAIMNYTLFSRVFQFVSLFIIELFNTFYKPQVSLLNQIQEAHSSSCISFGYTYNQTKVCLN